jgi:tRNA-specific 2-thiouridylase
MMNAVHTPQIASGKFPKPSSGSRNGQKVLMAMSGGVDSSVAAALLLEQGYDVVGCFMRLGSEDTLEQDTCDPAKMKIGHQGCCSVNDASDARLVCAMLGIPFYVMNFRKDFGRVIDYFVNEYNAGRTPNPCVRCNDWLKFGKLATYARSIEARFVATGHYARVDHTSPDGKARLLRGQDHAKDQSYVLFGTPQDQLDHMLLPIGDLEKPAVRELAKKYGLPVFDKPDSQEICFVPDNDYARLVRRQTPEQVRPGQVLDEQGRSVGEHQGHQHYTIGQRRGLGVTRPYPLYVIQKDAANNTITVGPREELLSEGTLADQSNWFINPAVDQPVVCQAKIRYNAQPVDATVIARSDDTLEVRFEEPQPAVTPGQAVVCYQGDHLIAGGWISQAL